MALYQNINGVWTQASKPYVKRNGIWVVAQEAWFNDHGVWKNAYDADVTPPNPPEIALQVFEDFDTIKGVKTLVTRYIKVGVRLPGSSNDPDVKMIRVLTNYAGKPPTTQFGGTYWKENDKDWPNENWSDWLYNSYGDHHDSSNLTYKQYPVNVGAGYTITGDKTYYFTAWSLDNSGNWSAATPASIAIPKDSVAKGNTIIKEARFQANSGGSWRTAGFQGGDLIQQANPRSVGLWFYGSQISEAMGTGGNKVTVRSAQVYIRREGSDEDNGAATANVYLYWTSYGSTADLPAKGNPITKHEITKLGSISKGTGKWFDLPASFLPDLNNNIRGMGLDWIDPIKANAAPNDYSRMVAVGQNLRCGEIHVTWEETLQ